VTYLGPSLPASEIARVAKSRNAKAIALSVVHPVGCTEVRAELERLRAAVPAETMIIIGGRAAESYRECLSKCEGVRWCGCLDEFEELLLGK
jgi:methylmalonyl-CoA mutase cobalamin-binding subunit